MNPTNLMEFISRRKSVRKFQMTPLNEAAVNAIEQAIKSITPLEEGIRWEMRLLPGEAVKGLLAIRAPHYLLLFSDKGPRYLENAGFLLQQMDLRLSSMGLGSCWLGLAKPVPAFNSLSELPFVISLAVGVPAEAIHRNGREEYSRKMRQEICPSSKHSEIIEAARLAPSATNSQPWRFRTTENAVHVYQVNAGLLKAWLYDRLNRIDMGIALCHLWIAGQAQGYQPVFYEDPDAKEGHPIGVHYTLSLQLKSLAERDS